MAFRPSARHITAKLSGRKPIGLTVRWSAMLGGNSENEAMNRTADHHAENCRRLAKILIEPLREVARRHGYALGVHGSLAYDIDLIACPWREGCVDQETVAKAIQEAVRAIVGNAEMIGDQTPTQKPHGRLAWSFHMGGGPYVDLSVLPPNY